ncbi:hypothetical protein ASG43_18465 [Aureimonas sp. Leaf454]|uniref:DUF4142 domain-containing protein n=1 Tax=Aureimonas sp. Leaf454 TaxID=1736381 RepID=UPI0006F6B731|nr:DUF4142 domain-containing protein [Aureimonas sp. Leaf454]KQT53210.1 hypothetical protein ASG43_18465 [Aureimonas sp. Leaf454]
MRTRHVLILALLPFAIHSVAAQTTPGLDAAVRSEMTPDEAFATNAASSDLFEIESSKIALEKASREDVKTFATHMIRDHEATSAKLKAAAAADGLEPISAPDSKRAQMIKNAQQAKKDHFDATYLNLQVTAHQEAVALFDDYAKTGTGQNLKAFAVESLPALQQHLEEAKSLDSQ